MKIKHKKIKLRKSKSKFRIQKRKKYQTRKTKRTNIYKFIRIIKLIILLISIIIIIISNHLNNKNGLYINGYNITSEKWIIMTASNQPTNDIINLERKINQEKIVVIGNNMTIDSNWDIFKNSKKLIYLSINAQKKLNYNILKFLNDDSYYRKN